MIGGPRTKSLGTTFQIPPFKLHATKVSWFVKKKEKKSVCLFFLPIKKGFKVPNVKQNFLEAADGIAGPEERFLDRGFTKVEYFRGLSDEPR